MADDYAEQQAMEVEALEAILMDDLQEVEDGVPKGWSPVGKTYKVVVNPQNDDGGQSEYPVVAEVVFAHTPSYPDEAPLVKARSLQGLDDDAVSSLQALIDQQIEENIGMPMIYTLITSAQEWLNDKALAMSGPTIDPELERKRAEEAEEARIAALRAHGTAVTPETFLAWRTRFEAEMALGKTGISEVEADGVSKKLTGKQWFLQQEEQHIVIEEPELEDDEEDGEGSRSDWSENEDLAEFEGSDDDEFLDEFLEEKS